MERIGHSGGLGLARTATTREVRNRLGRLARRQGLERNASDAARLGDIDEVSPAGGRNAIAAPVANATAVLAQRNSDNRDAAKPINNLGMVHTA